MVKLFPTGGKLADLFRPKTIIFDYPITFLLPNILTPEKFPLEFFHNKTCHNADAPDCHDSSIHPHPIAGLLKAETPFC